MVGGQAETQLAERRTDITLYKAIIAEIEADLAQESATDEEAKRAT